MSFSLEQLKFHIQNEPRLAALRTLPALLPEARVFLVGGALRDLFLGLPTKDFDICVAHATPTQVEAALRSFPGASVVFAGATFPVFKFRPTHESEEFDVALARTERSTGGGKIQDFVTSYDPSVTIEEDLSRRDFTWNAMAYEFSTGVLIDPFGGLSDLAAGVVRTVGNPIDRFTEDRTRALRAIRFAVRLGFTITPETWNAILAFTPRMNETTADGDYILKRELIGKEFVRAFDANPIKTLDLYDEAGLLEVFFPEITILKKIEQRRDFHPEGNVWIHTRLSLEELPNDASLTTKLAVLFHDLGKATRFQVFDRITREPITITVSPAEFSTTQFNPEKHLIKNIYHELDSRDMTERIMKTYAFGAVPGVNTHLILYLVEQHLLFGLPNWKLSKIERVFFNKDGDPIWELEQVNRADSGGSHRDFGYANLAKKYIEDLLRLREEQAKQPPRLVDGNDVMEVLKIKPGPRVKDILEAVREAQLVALHAGKSFTRSDALRIVRDMR